MATSVSPAVNMDTRVKNLQDSVEKLLSIQAEREAKSPAPGFKSGLTRFVPSGADPGWPTQEQVQRLSKSYDADSVRFLTRSSAKKSINATGHGGSIRRILEADVTCKNWHQHYGYNPQYGLEQLERETGFMPWRKFAEKEIKSGNGTVEKASNMAETSGILGGYAIPPDFRAQLLTIEEEESTILPYCMRVPMTTKTATWPSLDITTAYASGESPYAANVFLAWQPEAATINQTNAQLRQFNLTNWDMVAYVVLSNDLIQDNAVGLDMVVTNLLGTEAVFYMEYAAQNGLGASNSMPLGILNAPATIGVDRSTASTITVSDLVTMWSRVQQRSWNSASIKWHAHQSTIPKLAQLVSNSTTGQFALLNPNGEGIDGPMARGMPNKLFGGKDLHFTQTCQQLGNTGDLRLVDWAQYFWGERMGAQIAVSDQFLFTNNQIVIRYVARIGGAPWLNSYVTDSQGFTISPYVVLDVHS